MLTLGTAYQVRAASALRLSRLGGLSPATLRALRVGETRLEVAAGAMLPMPCDVPHLGLVVEGLLRVSIASPEGRVLTMRYLRPGDLIGVPSIVDQATAIADFRAVTDTTVAVFDVERARSLAERDASLTFALAEELGRMLRASVSALAAMAFGSVRQRIGRHLLDLATSTDREGRCVARVSQQELADAVGSVRDVVARNLGQLRDDGLIATSPLRIVILDPGRLHDATLGLVETTPVTAADDLDFQGAAAG
ncbi:MAG: Crp/Fnr family transcriptional regulator [Chloroflexi bacterium]|nr:Crp/Fnr family transcriptional regulator [Chloroflexota bacterium]